MKNISIKKISTIKSVTDKINSRIDITMQSIDGIEKAAPKPFLLTRINAALEDTANDTVWSKIAYYFKKPVIAAFAILLLVLINILVIRTSNATPDKDSVSLRTGPQKYDFAINVSVVYDIENQEP
ncbi:MAG: hypothetical protein ACKVOM_10485 [Ferruginibacter sp.]